jgi:hypothetical protein
VQIYENARNDEVAEADDANNIIQKNNSNFNSAEANKGILATNAIESEVLIDDNKADESHASPVATHAIESSSPAQANEVDHEGVAKKQGSKSFGLADSNPTAIPANYVNNNDNDANNDIIDSNEAVVAEAGETNVANDDVNTNDSNEVIDSTVADLADKQPHPPLQRTLPQHDPSNEAAKPPSDVTRNFVKSFTQVIGDDELFSKAVQIYENASNDEAAKSDDANAINDKSNADSNDAEVNKANVITHPIESALTIDNPPSDVIYDDESLSKTV